MAANPSHKKSPSSTRSVRLSHLDGSPQLLGDQFADDRVEVPTAASVGPGLGGFVEIEVPGAAVGAHPDLSCRSMTVDDELLLVVEFESQHVALEVGFEAVQVGEHRFQKPKFVGCYPVEYAFTDHAPCLNRRTVRALPEVHTIRATESATGSGTDDVPRFPLRHADVRRHHA